MGVQQDIKVRINAIVAGLTEVKRLTGELRDIEKQSDGSRGKLDILGKSGGASLSSLVKPAAMAVAGVAALGASAVTLLGTLFNLAKSTAEATGKFVDLSQQTGFTVETLSALDIGAQTSGGSIESISNALFIFTKNMGEANGKSKELTATFQKHSISTRDNEQALRDA